MSAPEKKEEPQSVAWVVGLIVTAGILIWVVAWWLTLPASRAAIAISAQSGSLTMEVLCGERLIWDLPAGQVGPRSAKPGDGAPVKGNVTLLLNAGSRVLLESTGAGVLRAVVDGTESIARNCGTKSAPPFQVSVDGTPQRHDAQGFNYAAAAPKSGQVPSALTLPLSGRVMLGQAIQQGGGWAAGATGILETGTVSLRVIPSFSDERVTISTEYLDKGSLLDTHPCVDGSTSPIDHCRSPDAAPAYGFLRTNSGGGLSVQVYVRGPVGVRAFGGAEQHLLTIPNFMAAWHSEVLKIWLVFIGLLIAAWKHLVDLLDFLKRAWTAFTTGKALNKAAPTDSGEDPAVAAGAEDRSKFHATGNAIVLGAVCLALASMPGHAEPVDIKQGESIGAGYSFRHGTGCLVVTAQHVVSELGVPVTVRDKTGRVAEGKRERAYNDYDLALVAVPDSSVITCTATWPDVGWFRGANFPAGAFRVKRHYAGGHEEIIRLSHAGGDDSDYFSLAPVDKLNVAEGHSGAIVELDGRLAGIVLSIDLARDRVKVLRFDRIDSLVGGRFRASSGKLPVSFHGVLLHGQENPTWSRYVSAWISERAGKSVVPTAPNAKPAQKVGCEIRVEVLSWERVLGPNPERDSVELQLKACGKRGFVFEQLCKQAQASSASTPPQVVNQKITANVLVKPLDGPPVSKLATSTYVPPSKSSQPEIELASLQAAAGPSLTELFSRGVCD